MRIIIGWLPYTLFTLLMLGGCAAHEGSTETSSGNSAAGSTYRGVLGDFCPPAQAMKGNC